MDRPIDRRRVTRSSIIWGIFRDAHLRSRSCWNGNSQGEVGGPYFKTNSDLRAKEKLLFQLYFCRLHFMLGMQWVAFGHLLAFITLYYKLVSQSIIGKKQVLKQSVSQSNSFFGATQLSCWPNCHELTLCQYMWSRSVRLSQRLDEKLINASACNKLSQSTFLSQSEWARQDKWFPFCISAPWTLLFFQQSVVIIILSSCGGVIKAACGYTNSHIKDQLNNTIARGVSSVPPWLPVSVADKYNR